MFTLKIARNKTDTCMKIKTTSLLVFLLFLAGCHPGKTIEDYGQHYQEHQDYTSLSKVVELMELEVDTSYVKAILGAPIDMGFDYRYLVDSTGSNNCTIGAVFHISEEGKIDQKWIDIICE